MKTIGLLGGMSWESTQTYYRLINEGVKSRLGGLHSAKLVLYRRGYQHPPASHCRCHSEGADTGQHPARGALGYTVYHGAGLLPRAPGSGWH